LLSRHTAAQCYLCSGHTCAPLNQCSAGFIAQTDAEALAQADVPRDIKKQADQLQTLYLQDALAQMLMAKHEYIRAAQRVEEEEILFQDLQPQLLDTGVLLVVIVSAAELA
jgi:hypothetical protein